MLKEQGLPCCVTKHLLECVLYMHRFTLNSKRKYTLWVSVSKYSKPMSCRTHDLVWGTALWSSTLWQKNVESMRRIHAHRVAQEGTCWMNQEGKTCAELVELTRSCGLYSTHILSTHKETKCILSFGVGCIWFKVVMVQSTIHCYHLFPYFVNAV